MNIKLENDLKQTMSIISANWKRQNNYRDKATDFIYKTATLEECLFEIEKTGTDKEYALHRWYNFKTSIQCEYIFCEFGAVHEQDRFNHDVDIYIENIPFDVKLTVYPAKLAHRPYDLSTREGKNGLIRWYYENQSQQGRKQLLNRLYVVCDGANSHENMVMKSNFDLMRKRISAYMQGIQREGINEISILDGRNEYLLKSDIILLDKGR